VGVLLAHTYENDGFPCGVDHVEGSAHLFINCVEFGQNNAIDCSRVRVGDGIVNEGLVELG
jgi:hypothetical protein